MPDPLPRHGVGARELVRAGAVCLHADRGRFVFRCGGVGQSVTPTYRSPQPIRQSRYLCRRARSLHSPTLPASWEHRSKVEATTMSATAIVSTAGFNGRKAPSRRVSAAGRRSEGVRIVSTRKSWTEESPARIRLNKATSLRGGRWTGLSRDHVTSAESVKRQVSAGRTWGRGRPITTSSASDQFQGVRHSYARVLPARRTAFGETKLEGLPSSTLHDLARKLVLVPAGHEFVDMHEPRSGADCVLLFR
jgi:hypothetical protein